jgi:hypothetical protein
MANFRPAPTSTIFIGNETDTEVVGATITAKRIPTINESRITPTYEVDQLDSYDDFNSSTVTTDNEITRERMTFDFTIQVPNVSAVPYADFPDHYYYRLLTSCLTVTGDNNSKYTFKEFESVDELKKYPIFFFDGAYIIKAKGSFYRNFNSKGENFYNSEQWFFKGFVESRTIAPSAYANPTNVATDVIEAGLTSVTLDSANFNIAGSLDIDVQGSFIDNAKPTDGNNEVFVSKKNHQIMVTLQTLVDGSTPAETTQIMKNINSQDKNKSYALAFSIGNIDYNYPKIKYSKHEDNSEAIVQSYRVTMLHHNETVRNDGFSLVIETGT